MLIWNMNSVRRHVSHTLAIARSGVVILIWQQQSRSLKILPSPLLRFFKFYSLLFKPYPEKRLQKSEMNSIMALTRSDIFPTHYNLLQRCQTWKEACE